MFPKHLPLAHVYDLQHTHPKIWGDFEKGEFSQGQLFFLKQLINSIVH